MRKRWAGYGVAFMIGVNVVAAAATITRAVTVHDPDWWAAISLVAVLAGAGGYAAGRVRPKQLASVAVNRRVHGWRKGDPLWLVAVPFIVVHPVVFARHYTRELWRTRRGRRAAA